MLVQSKKGLAAFWIILIIFLVLFLGFGGWFIWRFFLSGSTQEVPEFKTTATTTTGGKIDAALVGSWESECLVPVADNKWAEKHFFTFKSDSTATHIRKSWFMNDCTTLQPELTITDAFKVAIPSTGKINLTWTALDNAQLTTIGMSAADFIGKTQYDIYKIAGNTLMLGEGSRINYPTALKTGMSEADRFDTLNDYIVYKKK